MTRTAIRAVLPAVALAALVSAAPQARSQGISAQPASGPDRIEVLRLRPGLQLLRGAGGNVLAWSGSDGTLLVDSGTAPAAASLAEAVAGRGGSAVRFVVNTHWHPDHAGGNAAFAQAGAVVVAHENARARLSSAQVVEEYGLELPAATPEARPVVTFEDTTVLHLNGGRLQLLHVPRAHTDGDLVAWWPDAGVVHMGDLYYAGGYPFVDTASGGSLAGLIAALETMLSRIDARTIVVPGHGPPGTRADLVAYRDMLVAVGRRLRELAGQGASLDEVLAARPTADWDARYGSGGVAPARFVRILYEDLARDL
jgi:glyoxylase-like metal-dependent hydrolase (beta-lactamase superfamily II)